MTEFERGEREFEWEQDNGYPSHDDYLYLNRRKDNLKKYFLDPNCIESLQDEIIKLNYEIIRLEKELKLMEEQKDETHVELLVALNKNYERNEPLVQSYQIPKKVERPILKNLGRVAKSPSEYSLKGLNKQQIQEYTKRNTKKSINTKTYLIKNRRNGFYKIGRSKDPLKREQTLQSEEPDIVMVKTWDEDIESKLHKDYKDYRIRGEWFELSKAQVIYICTKYERS